MSSVVTFAAVGLVKTFMILESFATDGRLYGAFAARSKNAGKPCGLRHNENVQSHIGQGKLIPTTTLNNRRRISGEDACEDHCALRCCARARNDPGVSGVSGSSGSDRRAIRRGR